ncbi:AT-rich binding protein-like [Drosophila montana]|uniref:AT-rich binding protein-like n=1 Tax=Drosophila montana TaxID=40370 RepID=UPI00313CED17
MIDSLDTIQPDVQFQGCCGVQQQQQQQQQQLQQQKRQQQQRQHARNASMPIASNISNKSNTSNACLRDPATTPIDNWHPLLYSSAAIAHTNASDCSGANLTAAAAAAVAVVAAACCVASSAKVSHELMAPSLLNGRLAV